MTGKNKIRQDRNVAHLWVDKRILKFFRMVFTKEDYGKINHTYLAVCEIESDMRENGVNSVHDLVETCAAYTDMDNQEVREYLYRLEDLGLIAYDTIMDKATEEPIGDSLILHEWNEESLPEDIYGVEEGFRSKEVYKFYK